MWLIALRCSLFLLCVYRSKPGARTASRGRAIDAPIGTVRRRPAKPGHVLMRNIPPSRDRHETPRFSADCMAPGRPTLAA
jgi:hypothetical protein